MRIVIHDGNGAAPARVRAKDPVFKGAPDPVDYTGAASYLQLCMPQALVDKAIQAMKDAHPTTFRVNDIIRASGLPFLSDDDPSVKQHLDMIKDQEPQAPVLLVQGDPTRMIPLVIADGYHRCNAMYQNDPDTEVPCQLAVGIYDADN